MSTDQLVTDLVTLARNGGKQAWGNPGERQHWTPPIAEIPVTHVGGPLGYAGRMTDTEHSQVLLPGQRPR